MENISTDSAFDAMREDLFLSLLDTCGSSELNDDGGFLRHVQLQ